MAIFCRPLMHGVSSQPACAPSLVSRQGIVDILDTGCPVKVPTGRRATPVLVSVAILAHCWLLGRGRDARSRVSGSLILVSSTRPRNMITRYGRSRLLCDEKSPCPRSIPPFCGHARSTSHAQRRRLYRGSNAKGGSESGRRTTITPTKRGCVVER